MISLVCLQKKNDRKTHKKKKERTAGTGFARVTISTWSTVGCPPNKTTEGSCPLKKIKQNKKKSTCLWVTEIESGLNFKAKDKEIEDNNVGKDWRWNEQMIRMHLT